jgi:hypothetical protein
VLIELAILRDGPLSDDFERFPRLAARAAPAAICCFFDFAGIQKKIAHQAQNGIGSGGSEFSPEEVNRHTRQHDEHPDSRGRGRKKCKINNEQTSEDN